MTRQTLWRLVQRGDAATLPAIGMLQRPYYRLLFLGAAAAQGVLARLAPGALSLERLAAELGLEAAAHEGLRAWLDFGVSAGALRRTAAGYALRGWLAPRLAQPARDALAALVEETVTLHHRLVTESVPRLQARRPFTLADQRADLVARSSRVAEPLVFEAIDAAIPASGPMRLLEIGCGSGTYLRYTAERNHTLTAIGLELQREAADMARENIRGWNLAARVTIESGDVRARQPEPVFDAATLHNNIYYFPVDERVRLLAHVRGFLKPGGVLLLTTACRGGSAGLEILNLWAAVTEGCGRLPDPDELVRQLGNAGYVDARATRLFPGDRYYAFVGACPA